MAHSVIDAFELIQAVVKEMSGAGNDNQPHGRVFFEICREFSQLLDISVLVFFPVNQQQRLAAGVEKIKVILFERRTDADQKRHARIVDADFQSHAGAERKSAE